MSLGLFIGALVVLAIGLLIAGFGYYIFHTAGKSALSCKNLVGDFQTGRECGTQIIFSGIGVGIMIAAGVFIIVGFITSIIFGVKLVRDRRKRKKEIGRVE
jgi:UPF0716 family protein affecting phage T7 exclusion